MSNGAILWEGPSELDGRRIAVVITGLKRKTTNLKADLLQTWIIPVDESPMAAIKTGGDSSVCGDCRHRGTLGKGRTCYVNMNGPQSVWRAYHRGSYRRDIHGSELDGRKVRFGAWGDPAAAPVSVWAWLHKWAGAHTGYTHQWDRFPAMRPYVMASCDSPENRLEARSRGWRTFRVLDVSESGGVEPLEDWEARCPASDEAGSRMSCSKRLQCDGAGPLKDRAIINHSGTHRARLRRSLAVIA